MHRRPWRVEQAMSRMSDGREVTVWDPVDRSRFATKQAAEEHMQTIPTLDPGMLRVERIVEFEASQ